MVDATDKIATFRDMLKLLIESNAIKDSDSYEIADGINIALQSLSDNREAYITCAKMILASEVTTGIGIMIMVNTMFSLLEPSEVYELLANSHVKNRNAWLFAYFHEIPQEYIDQGELENLILTASRIILKKQEYSPFMVTIYFELQFNEYNIKPKDVVQKYIRDIKLLEQIYICVLENGHLADCHGLFLHEIFSADNSFVKNYVRWFITKEEKRISDHESVGDVFFQENDYLNILDYIIDEAISSLTFPSMAVPQIIKTLLLSGDKKYCEKSECWIKHQIENNYTNKGKMQYLFEALTEISIERAYSFIPFLIACTDDYDIFESIPLTPLSYSWSGSCVPMYSSWVEGLEKLLPILSGLKYIKHKNRVQQLIKSYRIRIKEEEISDILNG